LGIANKARVVLRTSHASSTASVTFRFSRGNFCDQIERKSQLALFKGHLSPQHWADTAVPVTESFIWRILASPGLQENFIANAEWTGGRGGNRALGLSVNARAPCIDACPRDIDTGAS